MPDEGADRADGRLAIDAALGRIAFGMPPFVPGRLGEAIGYALAGEGKRMRGLLVLAAYQACGGRGDASLLAAAVEVVHAYSLVHDDLPCMDDDDVRRGRPTVHRAWDVPVATVAGLVMIPLAARAAWDGASSLGLAPAARGAIVRRLMRASGAEGMVGGQLLDLDAEGEQVTIERLRQIHRGKTGSLIEAAVAIGGLGASAPPTVIAALERYGACVGLAFQIADDVLDVTATTAELGKTAGRDLQLRKSTYPGLLGIDAARARAEGLADEAVAALDLAGLDAGSLRELATFAVQRRS
ncbi:MAG: polyprenyl synthetase family protein [Gemmatimonadaceae bacterium]|nr:polyprenyl synthetase family protein [Gemmatimonadaceae bacterium]